MGSQSVGAVGHPDSDTGHVPLISRGRKPLMSPGRERHNSPQPVNSFIMMTRPQRSKSNMRHTPILFRIPSDTLRVHFNTVKKEKKCRANSSWSNQTMNSYSHAAGICWAAEKTHSLWSGEDTLGTWWIWVIKGMDEQMKLHKRRERKDMR